jgi:hypothetical protein
VDLKIEIRKLYALHEATIRFDHAIKEAGQTAWTDFTPSRFIYAFFTFNSIYSFDWEKCFSEKESITWSADEAERVPSEDSQFKAYLRYMASALKPDAHVIFSKELSCRLTEYGIHQPTEELREVNLVNATKKLKNLARQLPGEFRKLASGTAKEDDFYPSACTLFSFVYGVRCNLFHGRKTTVQLLEPAQQRRLLIYTAVLIAGNSLLFKAAEKATIGWSKVKADYAVRAGEE